MGLVAIVWHYWRSKRCRFSQRSALLAHQQRQWRQFERRVLSRSPYFKPYCGQPLAQWPIMDKASMMRDFNALNTAGLALEDVWQTAQAAEHSRDFSSALSGYEVGLSSGTSAQRGVFVVSQAERAQWAGVILAKLLPRGLLQRERVALILRANNNLYEGVGRSRRLQFRFFDLMQAFTPLCADLAGYQPSIIVAPAQVLCALARQVQGGELALAPRRVISAAEVLSAADRRLLESVFTEVHEVYQATEGFLAATCAHGRLHLNEEYVLFEEEWLDEQRFVPIITDFTRQTQPMVRYRLDDVLQLDPRTCPCGSATRVLAAIEGRLGDVVQLPGRSGQPVALFADALSRVFAQALPRQADYQLTQISATELNLAIEGSEADWASARTALTAYFEQQGVATEAVDWHVVALPQAQSGQKRRRIQVVAA
ncbi:MAG: CoF synthetase [Neisseriaceae bacterium]|nr:CoF synthetase [Neisseriaceae bacterium]